MMRLGFVLAILGFGLVVLFLNNDSGQSFGMDNDDFGRMIVLLPMVALLSAGILAGRRMGESLRYLSWWLLIGLGLVAAYLYRGDLEGFGQRLTAGLMPGRAVVATDASGNAEIILHRSRGGHFEADVSVDARELRMLVDTGASSIALSYEDAMRIGIDPDTLRYSQTILTANGEAKGAPVRLSQVAIGPIVRNDIRAIVAEPGRLHQSLLGMTFLGTLGSLTIQSDELRLRDQR